MTLAIPQPRPLWRPPSPRSLWQPRRAWRAVRDWLGYDLPAKGGNPVRTAAGIIATSCGGSGSYPTCWPCSMVPRPSSILVTFSGVQQHFNRSDLSGGVGTTRSWAPGGFTINQPFCVPLVTAPGYPNPDCTYLVTGIPAGTYTETTYAADGLGGITVTPTTSNIYFNIQIGISGGGDVPTAYVLANLNTDPTQGAGQLSLYVQDDTSGSSCSIGIVGSNLIVCFYDQSDAPCVGYDGSNGAAKLGTATVDLGGC